MSVLIKGLTIPTVGVRHCVISFSDNHLLISDVCGNLIFEGNYIEIPTPHGRLIDANAFLKWLKEFHPNDVAIMSGIKNARTIIEAEVGEG